MAKRVLIIGGGGFIGHHLAKRFKTRGDFVVCADIKNKDEASEYSDIKEYCDYYWKDDLTDPQAMYELITQYSVDEIYQLAADMGGAGYIFTGENDANIMLNSSQININLCKVLIDLKLTKRVKVFYSSSACIYPARNQVDPNNPNCKEDSAYPADPDSEYGWEKLFSERLYLAMNRNHGLNVKIARFHNIFGPEGTYCGGKEKAPAAICRKVALSKDGGSIDIWGNGEQTRSFLYIDECLNGVERLMDSNFMGPVNIGSDEMVTINQLAQMIIKISKKNIRINHIKGPLGVQGRNSDNRLIKEKLNWAPKQKLENGLKNTYWWIQTEVQ